MKAFGNGFTHTVQCFPALFYSSEAEENSKVKITRATDIPDTNYSSLRLIMQSIPRTKCVTKNITGHDYGLSVHR